MSKSDVVESVGKKFYVYKMTFYLVGYDEADAQTTFPFDSYDSAVDFAYFQLGGDDTEINIYTVQAKVDMNTIEKIGKVERN